jgi:hypothetical protein
MVEPAEGYGLGIYLLRPSRWLEGEPDDEKDADPVEMFRDGTWWQIDPCPVEQRGLGN